MNAPMEHPKQLAGLHDFSAQLAQRLREAPSREVLTARLGVRIGRRSYLVDMVTVGEIVPVASIARVPWTQPWFRGLANVRGRLVGVYDLPQLAGERAARRRARAAAAGDRRRAQGQRGAADQRAFGLRNAKDLDPLPAADEAGAPWEGASFRDQDGTTLTEMNLARLVADDRFTSISL
jgi:twitching motility protein PilI